MTGELNIIGTIKRTIHTGVVTVTVGIRRHRWSILSCLLLSFTLTLVSIRDFLFGSGFFEYSDQHWAPDKSVYPSGYFSPTPLTSTGYLYPLQFTRDFVTWPIGVFHALSLGSLLQEKLFYLYSFCLFVALSYLFSALIVRYALRTLGAHPVLWKQEVVRVSITTMIFTNLYFLYLNVDGGTVTTSLVGIFLGISLVVLVAEPDFVKALSVTVILSSLGFSLDPSNVIVVVGSVCVALLLRCVIARVSLRTFVVKFGELALGFGGTLLFLFYMFYPTLGAGPLSSDYGVRAYNLGSIQYFAMNTSLLNVLRFTGYAWTTLTFAPPTILTYSGSYQFLPGQQSPTTVLLLPGAITQVWVVSLFAPVAIAFVSLAVKRLRRFTLPFSIILLFNIGLTQWPWSSPSAQTVNAIVSLPAVGPLIGEAMYFPYYFMLGEAVSVTILVGALLTALIGRASIRTGPAAALSREPSLQEPDALRTQTPHLRPRPQYLRGELKKWAVFGAIVILVAFPGWQAFNGSYFPSRSWPTYVPGSGVPNAGPYEPVRLPADVQAAYNFIHDQPGDFSIYWPTGGANETNTQRAAFFFDAADAPKPLASLPALPGLVAEGATGALTSYLQAQDVHFLVLQNTSPVALQSDYGLSNWTALRMFFDQLPGLMPVLSFSNLTLYRVEGDWGLTYPISNILSYSGGSTMYPVAYEVGAGLHSWPAIVSSSPANQTLSIDNLSGSESILSPGFLVNYAGIGVVAQPTLDIPIGAFATNPAGPFANFSAEAGNLSLRLIQRAGTVLMIDNWSLIDWGPSNVSLDIMNGSIKWTAQEGPATVTANFGQSLTAGPGGVMIENPGPSSSVTSLSLDYWTSGNFEGSLAAYLVNEAVNTSSSSYTGQTILAPSLLGQSVEFNAPTIAYTRYFTTRFQTILHSGSVEISRVNYSWNNPSLHFRWNVSGNLDSLGGWSLLNWSAQGSLSYGYSDGNLWWNASSPATVSLNFGPPLVNGPGGVSNPFPSTAGVSVSMTFLYRTSRGFQGMIGVNGYYQPSSSSTAGALATSGPTLLASEGWREVSYSTTLPPSTRSFTIRLQATAFTGAIELSDVTSSWAYLPVALAAPFGHVVQVSKAATISFPAPVSEVYISLNGAAPPDGVLLSSSNNSGGFDWYLVPGSSLSLQSGDLVAVVVPVTHLLSGRPVGTIYTGPFAVDLILVSGTEKFRPYETLDTNALFLFTETGNFTIEHSAVVGLTVSYLVFLLYLALFYPAIVQLRRRLGLTGTRPSRQRSGNGGKSNEPKRLRTQTINQDVHQSEGPAHIPDGRR